MKVVIDSELEHFTTNTKMWGECKQHVTTIDQLTQVTYFSRGRSMVGMV
jgi:hypothetical protein